MLSAQALVEQFSAAGQPEAVERCVLHMDVASLDFSQVCPNTLVLSNQPHYTECIYAE